MNNSVISCPFVKFIHCFPPGCLFAQAVRSQILFSTIHKCQELPHSQASLFDFYQSQMVWDVSRPRDGMDCFVSGTLNAQLIGLIIMFNKESNFYQNQDNQIKHLYSSIISITFFYISFPLILYSLDFFSSYRYISCELSRTYDKSISNLITYNRYQLMEVQGKQVVLVEGQLKKIIHAEGEGDLPQNGQEIFALYRGTLLNGTEFDSNQDRENPFSFVLGQGRVIKGWDVGFASMRKGEKATLVCSPDYAYGARGSPPKIPANATLNFQVQLLDFKDKKKEKWEYSDEEKLASALALKESGNEKLKTGNAKGAVDDYKEGIDFVEHETLAESKQLLKTLRLNIAQAYLKLNKNSDVVDQCTKVLKDEPNNLKALYRRGVAYGKSQDFDRAQTDFKELLKHDPANAEAKKELADIAVALKKFREKEKKVFGGIFAKGGLYDDVKVEPKIEPQVKKVESEDSEDEIKENKIEEETPIVQGEHQKTQ